MHSEAKSDEHVSMLDHALERVAKFRNDRSLLPYQKAMIALADEIYRLRSEAGRQACCDILKGYSPEELAKAGIV